MVSLPIGDTNGHSDDGCGTSCGTSCGNGLEKIYPTTAVRYGAMNWIGEFTYKEGWVFSCGGKVVIRTDRGVELGEQVSLTCNGCSNSVSREQIKRYIDTSGPEFFRLQAGRILRPASPEDIAEHERLNGHVREDVDRSALMAAQLRLDMKIVTVEHLFGGERIVFYFRSEGRVDFRQLVRELANHYRTRIEMRQVGARDEARLVADYEVCGRECCCKNFLKKLRPVNMKMAKLQKSTLDPSKVSGRCGRLRCCLRYEHESYEELVRKLPRQNSRVRCEHGEGTVVDRQVLTQLVLIRMDDNREMTVPVEEITAFNLPKPPPAPPVEAAPGARPRPVRPPKSPGRPLAEEPYPDLPDEDEIGADSVVSGDSTPDSGKPPLEWTEPMVGPPASEASEAAGAETEKSRRKRRRRRGKRGDRAADTVERGDGEVPPPDARPEMLEDGPPGEADRPGDAAESADDRPPRERRRRRRRRRGPGGSAAEGGSSDGGGDGPGSSDD